MKTRKTGRSGPSPPTGTANPEPARSERGTAIAAPPISIGAAYGPAAKDAPACTRHARHTHPARPRPPIELEPGRRPTRSVRGGTPAKSSAISKLWRGQEPLLLDRKSVV